MKNSVILYIIVAALIGGAGGFLGGVKFQELRRPSFASRTGIRMMQGGNFVDQSGNSKTGNSQTGRIGMMNRPFIGTVTSVDDKSATVSLEDGSSKIIMFSDKTTYTTSQKVSKTDLKSGVKVSVFGVENTDGSLTASSVMLNPQERVQLSQ